MKRKLKFKILEIPDCNPVEFPNVVAFAKKLLSPEKRRRVFGKFLKGKDKDSFDKKINASFKLTTDLTEEDSENTNTFVFQKEEEEKKNTLLEAYTTDFDNPFEIPEEFDSDDPFEMEEESDLYDDPFGIKELFEEECPSDFIQEKPEFFCHDPQGGKNCCTKFSSYIAFGEEPVPSEINACFMHITTNPDFIKE